MNVSLISRRPSPFRERQNFGKSSGPRSHKAVTMVKPPAKATGRKRMSKNIKKPGNNDVLCGRGGSINAHPGNEHFRQVVEKHKRVYLNARFKQEKRLIASSIVSEIRARCPAGRFLAKDARKGTWSDIGDEKACDKTLQALRENAPALRGDVKKDKKKPPQSQKVAPSSKDQDPARNPLGMAQKPGAPVGVARFPHAAIPHAAFLPASFPQQVPTHPQWHGRCNYYPQVAHPLPNGARGPLHAAQVGPPCSQPIPGPLRPPPPLPDASRILQTLPVAAAQTNVAATNSQSPEKSGCKSYGAEEKQLCDSLTRNQEEKASLPQGQGQPAPDAVAGQLASPSKQSAATGVKASQGNAPSTQLQSNKDISPKAKPSMTTVINTAKHAGDRVSEPSQGLKRTATVQFPQEDRLHKRLRGDYVTKSSRYNRDANGGLPSIEPRKDKSPGCTSSQGGTTTQSVAMPSSSPRKMATSYGRRMVAPYSPIKAAPAMVAAETPEGHVTGSQNQQPKSSGLKWSDDHKGSFYNSVTQHLLGPWDPDSLCGGSISEMFGGDETDSSLQRLQNKGQGVVPRTRNLPQETIPEKSGMDYDPTSPSVVSGDSSTNKMHRRTPSWEESLQRMSPFRFQPTPVPPTGGGNTWPQVVPGRSFTEQHHMVEQTGVNSTQQVERV